MNGLTALPQLFPQNIMSYVLIASVAMGLFLAIGLAVLSVLLAERFFTRPRAAVERTTNPAMANSISSILKMQPLLRTEKMP